MEIVPPNHAGIPPLAVFAKHVAVTTRYPPQLTLAQLGSVSI